LDRDVGDLAEGSRVPVASVAGAGPSLALLEEGVVALLGERQVVVVGALAVGGR
jgi:hypothetical protein